MFVPLTFAISLTSSSRCSSKTVRGALVLLLGVDILCLLDNSDSE
jgi:hypothetical protein